MFYTCRLSLFAQVHLRRNYFSRWQNLPSHHFWLRPRVWGGCCPSRQKSSLKAPPAPMGWRCLRNEGAVWALLPAEAVPRTELLEDTGKRKSSTIQYAWFFNLGYDVLHITKTISVQGGVASVTRGIHLQCTHFAQILELCMQIQDFFKATKNNPFIILEEPDEHFCP